MKRDGTTCLLVFGFILVMPSVQTGCAPACVPEVEPPQVQECPVDDEDLVRAIPTSLSRDAPGEPFQGQIPGPTSLAELQSLVDLTRSKLVPELDGVEIRLTPAATPNVFFAARVDVETLGRPEFERRYVLAFNPDVFVSPPPASAVVAILAHELRHILDYTSMHGFAFATFGATYATGDVANYERRVDAWVLDLGCHAGLSDFREWLYLTLDDDAVKEKKRVYMTPGEIATDAIGA